MTSDGRRHVGFLYTLALALTASAGTAGCAVKDKLYCETDQDCADNPGRPYCDVAGAFPESEGIGKTCIASPFDAGLPADAATADGPVDAAPTWSPFEIVGVTVDGLAESPCTSDDGLTLYFTSIRQGSAAIQIDRAVRGTTSEPFGSATLLFADARYPEISADGLELYFTRNSDGQLMVATRPSAATAFGTPTTVGIAGSFPSISGDKLALYFVATLTGVNGELRRVTRTAVGQPWSLSAAVPLAGPIEIYSSIDVANDERAILRAPTVSGGGPVVIQRRPDTNSTFGEAEALPEGDVRDVAFRTARWAQADTEVWIGETTSGGLTRPAVSRLR